MHKKSLFELPGSCSKFSVGLSFSKTPPTFFCYKLLLAYI